MKGIVCQRPGKFEYIDIAPPQLNDDKVLLEIRMIGICGTDLHAYAGRQPFFTYPRILGHELAAEVISVGDRVEGVHPGDKAVIMPYISCGKCAACEQGKTNCCQQIKVLGVHVDGGMQEAITLSPENILITPQLNFDDMAIVEPLSIGYHALTRAGVIDGKTVVVVGCGPIGLGIIKLASIQGARVVGVDVNEHRLKDAQENYGAHHSFVAGKNAIEELKIANEGRLADIVIDASGSRQALESGIEFMGHGGQYILVGLYKGELTFHHPSIHAKETTLKCSRNATIQDFNSVIDILSKGLFPVRDYITHRVEFNEMIDHFDNLLDPASRVTKAILTN